MTATMHFVENVVCVHIRLMALAWFWATGRIEDLLHITN